MTTASPQSAQPGPATARASGRTSLWASAVGLQKRAPIVQLAGTAICFIYAMHEVPGFGDKSNILTIAVLTTFLALSALGLTFVLMLGGIDLSIGNMIGFGAVLVPTYATDLHIPFGLCILLGVIVAALIGAASGALSYFLGVHSLMITLALGTCVEGWTLIESSGHYGVATPGWVETASRPTATTLGVGIPPLVCVAVAVTLVSLVILYRTPLGRRIFAVGVNQHAASLALMRPARVWVGAFVFSAVAATLIGVMLGGFSGTSDATVGDPYLFQGVAAVVVGGTAFGGGRGDFLRTVVGALFLTVLSTTLVSLNYDAADTQIISGILIFLVVTTHSRERSARSRV